MIQREPIVASSREVLIKQDDCYREINADASDLAAYALTEAKDPERKWYGRYHGMTVSPLNKEKVFSLSPEMAFINSIAPFAEFGVGVAKMECHHHYKLHTDWDRGPGINMLLQSQNSFCAFVDIDTDQTVHMNYQPNKLYIFNTQVPHTIFNFEGERFLLTVEFEEHKQVMPYQGFLKRLKREQKLTGSLSLIQ